MIAIYSTTVIYNGSICYINAIRVILIFVISSLYSCFSIVIATLLCFLAAGIYWLTNIIFTVVFVIFCECAAIFNGVWITVDHFMIIVIGIDYCSS